MKTDSGLYDSAATVNDSDNRVPVVPELFHIRPRVNSNRGAVPKKREPSVTASHCGYSAIPFGTFRGDQVPRLTR
jgi:hypothetical protein